MPSSAGQALRPPSGAPCHLQDIARSAEALKRSCHLCDLSIPFHGQVRPSVEAAPPLPPLVIFRRTSSIVGSLLGEESLVIHSQFSHQLPPPSTARIPAPRLHLATLLHSPAAIRLDAWPRPHKDDDTYRPPHIRVGCPDLRAAWHSPPRRC